MFISSLAYPKKQYTRIVLLFLLKYFSREKNTQSQMFPLKRGYQVKMTSWVGNASEKVASVIAVILMATSHGCPWLHITIVLGDVFSLQVAIKKEASCSFGSSNRIRTCNLPVNSRPLYR